MIKYISLALLLLLPTSFVKGEQDPSSLVQQPEKPKPRPRPQQDISYSFSRFLHHFYSLITQPSLTNHIKTVEKMFASLMHASYQAIQTAKPYLKPQKRSDGTHGSLSLDQKLLDDITDKFTASLKEQMMTRKATPKQNSLDPDSKKILQKFSGIVANFFKIVENPENVETVPENLKGMINNVIDIGTIAMTTKGAPALDADYEELKAYAHQLDTETKEALYTIVITAHERSGFSFT